GGVVALPSAHRAFQCHGASDSNLGGSTSRRGISGRHCAEMVASRSRQRLQRELPPASRGHDHRRSRLSPSSPWQNPYVERLISPIRRECLDHMIVLNASHLRRILAIYGRYYHRSRTHLGLKKDAPDPSRCHHHLLGRSSRFRKSVVFITAT